MVDFEVGHGKLRKKGTCEVLGMTMRSCQQRDTEGDRKRLVTITYPHGFRSRGCNLMSPEAMVGPASMSLEVCSGQVRTRELENPKGQKRLAYNEAVVRATDQFLSGVELTLNKGVRGPIMHDRRKDGSTSSASLAYATILTEFGRGCTPSRLSDKHPRVRPVRIRCDLFERSKGKPRSADREEGGRIGSMGKKKGESRPRTGASAGGGQWLDHRSE
ncbi:hypothetical protein CBR_g31180 [Chara braunii]|uniref:Uncharacterized protein n=1 Tax=Chara braunii TaxID=69332 RepID=A0A388JXJ7_CHABU|nr:hypothetical protein CBR_g31180 [Chara braunii]|eukprot:GBG62541.1 hypothetical protein CBR_g31180 [Chara braunii]